jgi:hypothetical protein
LKEGWFTGGEDSDGSRCNGVEPPVLSVVRRVRGAFDREAGQPGAPPAAPEGALTVVAVDDELRRLGLRLQQALGPSYRVTSDPAAAAAAAIVVPALLTRVEMLRAAHPRAFIVVYDDGGNEPARYLEARADDYVSGSSMAELAARIRAGLRRLDWQRPTLP